MIFRAHRIFGVSAPTLGRRFGLAPATILTIVQAMSGRPQPPAYVEDAIRQLRKRMGQAAMSQLPGPWRFVRQVPAATPEQFSATLSEGT